MVDLMKAPQEALQAVLGRSNKPKYATPLFQLRDIPSVMRSRLGWPVGACQGSCRVDQAARGCEFDAVAAAS
ncbi:hypothetical protein C7Y68_04970, partial [Paracidovorax avenae]